MFKIRKLFLFLSLGLLANVPTITFGMNKRELENLSITELDKLFKTENSPTRLKQQILLILLKQKSIYVKTDNLDYHIQDYLKALPHNQEFLEDLCKANLLQKVMVCEPSNRSHKSVIDTCIECCYHEPLIRKIAAARCSIELWNLKDFLPQHISKRLPTKNMEKGSFKDIFDKAKEKNKTFYKHFFRRVYLYHLLYRIFLHKVVEKEATNVLTKIINDFIEEPFASNKHEEQDNKERITFLREKFGDFQINIDGEKIKTSKLFLILLTSPRV